MRSVAAAWVGLEDAALRVEGGLREASGGVDAAGREDAAVDQREEDDPHNCENEAWSEAPRRGAKGRRGSVMQARCIALESFGWKLAMRAG